jgi:uncharacterized protein
MADRLPVEFDPKRLAVAEARFSAELPLAQFQRLVPELASADGVVYVEVAFSLDRARRAVAAGKLCGAYPLVCQRCMAGFNWRFEREFELTFAESEAEAEEWSDELEPVLLDEFGRLRAIDMLEDELLLLVPIVPKHADEHDCDANFVYNAQPTENQPQQQRENPFAALSGLKTNN